MECQKIRQLTRSIMTFAVALALLTSTSALCKADNARIDTSTLYKLVASHSDKVLDVASGSTDNGAAVIQWDYHGGANQLWRFHLVEGNQYYVIEASHSGKVLDVAGGSTDNGAAVIQWDYHGGANQIWRLVRSSDGSYFIQAKHSGKVLDVAGGSTDSGAHIIQWDNHGGANQIWRLEPAFDITQHATLTLSYVAGTMIPWAWTLTLDHEAVDALGKAGDLAIFFAPMAFPAPVAGIVILAVEISEVVLQANDKGNGVIVYGLTATPGAPEWVKPR
jgi:hypothetical protein